MSPGLIGGPWSAVGRTLGRKLKVSLISALAVALAIPIVAGYAVVRPDHTLVVIEWATALAFDIEEITPELLVARQAAPDSIHYSLFDVRLRDEFDRSHIRNAVRIDPDMDAAAFLDAHGDQLAGKHLVFYCSVGYRSSTVVERISAAAYRRGARSVVNLRGGIFRWYNEAREVYTVDGKITDDIHPYGDLWAFLITRPRQLR